MTQGFDIMKLFQEAGRIQERVSSEQSKLAAKHYAAEAGAGMVTVTVNGIQEVISIHVDPDAMENLGLEAVLELVTAATNVALQKARDASKDDMMHLFQEMTKGLTTPE
jgi:DNA-binding YbaB/EbfC family protein